MTEARELSADGLLEGFQAKRDALRKEYAARQHAFTGFASTSEAATVYFGPGLARDVFCCIAEGGVRGLMAKAIAEQLSADAGEVAKVLEQEGRSSNVFQRAEDGRWQLPSGSRHLGCGAQHLWEPLKECLRGSSGLTLKVRAPHSS